MGKESIVFFPVYFKSVQFKSFKHTGTSNEELFCVACEEHQFRTVTSNLMWCHWIKMLYISRPPIPQRQYYKTMLEFSEGEKVYDKDSKMFDTCLPIVIYFLNQLKNKQLSSTYSVSAQCTRPEIQVWVRLFISLYEYIANSQLQWDK